MELNAVKEKVRAVLFPKFITGVDGNTIDDDYLLITNGLLDSINVLRLVDQLEKEFNVEFKSHEVDKDNLNSINLIASFISKKM